MERLNQLHKMQEDGTFDNASQEGSCEAEP